MRIAYISFFLLIIGMRVAAAAWKMDSVVNPEEMGSYLEGDIIVHNSRNGLTAEAARWPGGIVPYEMGAYFSEYVCQVCD
jgi:hypothetical protein